MPIIHFINSKTQTAGGMKNVLAYATSTDKTKSEGKQYVTVLDFIGNDYKRSVQIAFALGSLSENFVVEKKLVAAFSIP